MQTSIWGDRRIPSFVRLKGFWWKGGRWGRGGEGKGGVGEGEGGKGEERIKKERGRKVEESMEWKGTGERRRKGRLGQKLATSQNVFKKALVLCSC